MKTDEQVDTSNKAQLDLSTRLAFDRTRVAFDRTVMAWIRTATSLITFGFSVYKFFQLEIESDRLHNRLLGPREFGMLMVGAGLLSLLIGTAEHHQNIRSLVRQYSEMPRSRVNWVAAFIAIIGIFAFIAAIFRQ